MWQTRLTWRKAVSGLAAQWQGRSIATARRWYRVIVSKTLGAEASRWSRLLASRPTSYMQSKDNLKNGGLDTSFVFVAIRITRLPVMLFTEIWSIKERSV